jgi:hypothetical protein
MLVVCLIAQILVAWPLVLTEGFGIQSEGSRIAFLYEGTTGKYLAYAGVGLGAILAGLVALRVSRHGKPGYLGAISAALVFALSVASGSKGGFFLWVGSVAALIDYRRARMAPFTSAVIVCALLGGLVWSVAFLADALAMTVEDFVDLAFSRFFLNNDARAIVFDLRSTATGGLSLVTESFRSLSSLVGMRPANDPLGVLLYDTYFGPSGGNGANASLIALILYYMPSGLALGPVIASALGAVALYAGIAWVASAMRHGWGAFVVLSLGFVAVQQYSQDFLAFQVLMPMVCAVVLLVWILDRRHVAKRSDRTHQNRPPAASQHHHSVA